MTIEELYETWDIAYGTPIEEVFDMVETRFKKLVRYIENLEARMNISNGINGNNNFRKLEVL